MKGYVLPIRLSAQQRAELVAAADARGMTLSGFVREAALVAARLAMRQPSEG